MIHQPTEFQSTILKSHLTLNSQGSNLICLLVFVPKSGKQGKSYDHNIFIKLNM